MAGNRTFSGLPPQRAGIQRQNKNQQKSGDFVHKADLEQRRFAIILPLQSRFCNYHRPLICQRRVTTAESVSPSEATANGLRAASSGVGATYGRFRIWFLSCCSSDRSEL